MLGIKLIKPNPDLSPISFDYEMRSLEYIEIDGNWFIAGGDKAGLLKVFSYDGKKIIHVIEKKFDYKIMDSEFVLYGENYDKLGLIVALETDLKANLYFNPDINIPQAENNWHFIENENGKPQLVFQPYIMKELNKIFLSFQSGYFVIAKLEKTRAGYYKIIKEWDHRFPSKIIDCCAEFPKYLERTRKQNREADNSVYLASKAGCILILVIDCNRNLRIDFPILHGLKTVHNSVRTIIPINKIYGACESIRGILGIAGTTFLCLYRDKNDTTYPENYRILTESFPNNLYSLDVGIYETSDGKVNQNNIILIGDSQRWLHARQFESKLNPQNVPEIIFEDRLVFRVRMKDRVFGITPIILGRQEVNEPDKQALLRLALGLGSHEIVFKDLLDKNNIIEDIKRELELDASYVKTESRKKAIGRCLKLARKTEFDLQLKYNLMAALFESKPQEDALALIFLLERLLEEFDRLIYWLLSTSNKVVCLYIYKRLCHLIQVYNEKHDQSGKDIIVYKKLGRLLIDIDKFWIGGETYSSKIGEVSRLIDINKKNKKNLDQLIYMARLNDRSYAVETITNVSKHKICSIAQINQLFLVADTEGGIFILDSALNHVGTLNIKDHIPDIYGQNFHTSPVVKNYYIRQIVISQSKGWGFLLLQTGGIWAFPLDNLYRISADAKTQQQTVKDALFITAKKRLIEPNIVAYSMKANSSGDLYLCDNIGQFYKLEFTENIPHRLSKIDMQKPLYERSLIRDFDFLDETHVVLGDISGGIKIVDLKNYTEKPVITIPTAPHFNVCFAWNTDSAILGTEEGDVIAIDFSGSQSICRWAYKLPGPVQFIQKTEDGKLLVGGLCPRVLLIDPSGNIENYIHLDVGHEEEGLRHNSINAVYPLSSEIKHEGEQILFLSGDEKGTLAKYRFYHPRIFEKPIKIFFNSYEKELNEKVKLRCINIRENTLRRLYTAFESRSCDFDELRQKTEQLVQSRDFSFHAGPLVHLLSRFFSEFENRFKKPHSIETFRETYDRLQNTLTLLINSWGIKNDPHCQKVMQVIGINLFKIASTRRLLSLIREVEKEHWPVGIRSPYELIESIYVHCMPETLILMYERVRMNLSDHRESPYLESIVEFICQKLGEVNFDLHMPDPLPLKKVELLAFLVDYFKFCPIKMCYHLFEKNVNKSVFHHLIYKVKEVNAKTVYSAAYNFADNLYQFENITDELVLINSFKEIFPERFQDTDDAFYKEFLHIFESSQKILNYSDALEIASRKSISYYTNETFYFHDLINWLNTIVGHIADMKAIFEDMLGPKADISVPRNELVELKKQVRDIYAIPPAKFGIGEVYGYFLSSIVDHISNILFVFCEVTLPILILENTATFLEDYLDEIRRKHQPLPALDNPDTIKTYNHFFRNMFETLIVGMYPKYACFHYPEIIEFKRVNYLNLYQHNMPSLEIKTEQEIEEFPTCITAVSQTVEEILLFLPDNTHEYAKFKLAFSEEDTGNPRFNEKMSRFRGFVSVLNLYVIAFNGLTEAEMQSRFSHRLFAHQSKEPLLSMRNQLVYLTDKNFKDDDGSVTSDYHLRLRRLVEQMLHRSDFILNVRKLFRHASPEITTFRLGPVVLDVVKSMRKVFKFFNYKGDILIDSNQELDEIELKSDEPKLREILEQLIRNSIKYNIEVRKITLNIRYDKRKVILKIKDNGVGIPETELPYIFAPYYRGVWGESKNIDGDGLGLWVSKLYAEMLGGELTAKNIFDPKKNRVGATFTVVIPRKFIVKKKKRGEDERPEQK